MSLPSINNSEYSTSDRIFHTPSSFSKNNLLYVQEAGQLKSLKSHKSQRDALDSYLLLVVLSGTGTLYYNNELYNLIPGNIAFLDCNTSYYHESSENDPWELMWVHFNGVTAQSYFNAFYEHNKSIILTPDNLHDFSSIIKQLMQNQASCDFTSEIYSSKLITDLLTLCFTTIHSSQQATNLINKQLEYIREYINEHYKERINVDSLAKQQNLSTSTLIDEFHKSFGISIERYIKLRRISYSKQLLRFSMQSLEEIALSCGFETQREFEQAFYEDEAMSPIQYKMKW